MALLTDFPCMCIVSLLVTASSLVASQPRVCVHGVHEYDTPDPYPCAGKWLFADFNGDGRADGFCNNDGTTADFYHLTPISGVYADSEMHRNPKTEGWCASTEGIMMTGDVNGDGKNDLVCRFNDGTKFQVVYYNNGGFRSPMTLRVLLACPMATSSLLIGDVDGDGAADFVCTDQSSGAVRVHYNGGEHSRLKRHAINPRLLSHFHNPGYYQVSFSFCRGTSKFLRLGDVNGDRRQDLVCFENTGKTNGVGGVDIAFAKSHGRFDKVTTLAFTNALCSGDLDEFFVSDVNGDGFADLVCHDAGTAEDVMFYDHKEQRFSISATYNNEMDECENGATFLADVNGDGMSDVACRDENDDDELDLFFGSCTF